MATAEADAEPEQEPEEVVERRAQGRSQWGPPGALGALPCRVHRQVEGCHGGFRRLFLSAGLSTERLPIGAMRA